MSFPEFSEFQGRRSGRIFPLFLSAKKNFDSIYAGKIETKQLRALIGCDGSREEKEGDRNSAPVKFRKIYGARCSREFREPGEKHLNEGSGYRRADVRSTSGGFGSETGAPWCTLQNNCTSSRRVASARRGQNLANEDGVPATTTAFPLVIARCTEQPVYFNNWALA